MKVSRFRDGSVVCAIAAAVTLTSLLHTSCTSQQRAGWRIGSTLADYQGQVLRVPNGPGAKRLEIEKDYDPTIRHFVEQNETPDYILVESNDVVQLIFIEDDRVVRFQRSGLNPKSRALITDGVPEPLAAQFTREDQRRLSDTRASRAATVQGDSE